MINFIKSLFIREFDKDTIDHDIIMGRNVAISFKKASGEEIEISGKVIPFSKKKGHKVNPKLVCIELPGGGSTSIEVDSILKVQIV